MDKRLLVVFLVLVAGGFIALALMNKRAPEPQTTAPEPAAEATTPPARESRHALEETVTIRSAEEGDGFIATVSNIGATVASVKMVREQYDQPANDERSSPLPPELRGLIPERFYEPGKLELVTTWDPASYPFRIAFDSFQYAGRIRRELRAERDGGRVDPARPDVFEAAPGLPGFATTYPAVMAGDRLEIVAPAALVVEGGREIRDVRGDGQLTVHPPFAVDAPVENVRYRVVTEGDFAGIFARDQRFTLVDQAEKRLTYVWPNPRTDESDLFLERQLEIASAYAMDSRILLHNFGRDEVREQLALVVQVYQPPVTGGGIFTGPPVNENNALCHVSGDMKRATPKELIEEPGSPDWNPPGEVEWAGVESRYFLLAAIPLNLTRGQCRMSAYPTRPPLGVVQATVGRTQSFTLSPATATCRPDWLTSRSDLPACGELLKRLGLEGDAGSQMITAAYERLRKSLSGEALEAAQQARTALTGRRAVRHDFRLYMGPKDIDQLGAQDVGLTDAIDFWVVGIIARPMVMALRFFHDLIPHWGVAIVLLTILVKLILFPITQRSFKSMRAMQKLKPEMDKLREKYGNDKQKLNEQMMLLYKRHKVNPLGGCLPTLLQMPVYIALYRAIYSSVELFQAPLFGWVNDLSAPDPYFILPVVLGASMFVQQKLTPTSMDSAQARMMQYVMPVMFTALMLFLPSGLVLYIFVNTLLSLVQQMVINRQDPMPPARPAAPAKA